MPYVVLPAIASYQDKKFWEAIGKTLEGLTDLLSLRFPDDKGIRVSSKMLQGAVNGQMEAMTEDATVRPEPRPR